MTSLPISNEFISSTLCSSCNLVLNTTIIAKCPYHARKPRKAPCEITSSRGREELLIVDTKGIYMCNNVNLGCAGVQDRYWAIGGSSNFECKPEASWNNRPRICIHRHWGTAFVAIFALNIHVAVTLSFLKWCVSHGDKSRTQFNKGVMTTKYSFSI